MARQNCGRELDLVVSQIGRRRIGSKARVERAGSRLGSTQEARARQHWLVGAYTQK
jgi:hypothetical protein